MRYNIYIKLLFILFLLVYIIYPVMGAECTKTTYTSGNVTNLSFTTASTCNWTIPYGVTSVGYDIIGGGGGGGMSDMTTNHGNGGGAASRTRGTLTIPLSQTVLNISVGLGGNRSGSYLSYPGNMSTINTTITAAGGGAGSNLVAGAAAGGAGSAGYWTSSGVTGSTGSSGDYAGGAGGAGYGAGGGGAGSKSTSNPGGSGSRGYVNISYSVLNETTSFIANDTVGQTPLPVLFNDTSTGTYLATSWLWEFGDGNTSTSNNATYTYLSAGNYTVTLTRTTYNGTYTLTYYNYITATNSPYVPLINSGMEYGNGTNIPLYGVWTWIGHEKYSRVTYKDGADADGYISSIMFDANTSHSGNKSLNITVNPTAKISVVNITFVDDGMYGQVLPHDFTVEPGKSYNFTVWIKKGITSGSTYSRLATGPYGYTAGYYCYAHALGASGVMDWTRWSATCDIPSVNNVSGNIQTFMYGNGTMWIDDLKLMKMLTPNITSNITTGGPPLMVQFNGTATNGTPIYWNWSFGDGYYSEVQNATHSYSAVGNYTVKLTVANGIGNENPSSITNTNYISVISVTPINIFNCTPLNGNAPLSISCVDSSTGGISSRLWEFGDGNTSTSQNVTYIYPSVGNYTVTLNVTNGAGSNATSKINYITAIREPYVPLVNPGFEYGSGIRVGGDNWIGTEKYGWRVWTSAGLDGINATTMYDANTSHSGSKSMLQNVTYSFGANYSLLSVNHYGINTKEHCIIVQPNITYNFSFWAKTDVGSFPNVPRLRMDSGVYSKTLTNYTTVYIYPPHTTWAFHTGMHTTNENSTCLDIQYYYPYWTGAVWLDDFKVMKTLTPNISANITTSSSGWPFPVQFIGSASNGTPTYWNWSFGDGYYSEIQNPVHIYTAPGNFSVVLTTANGIGNENPSNITKIDYISVYGSTPITSFYKNDTYGNRLLPIEFTDLSTNDPTSWEWNATNVTGNNTPITFSTIQNTTFTFDVGNWFIELVSTNSLGSNTSIQNSWVNVTQLPPVANMTIDPAIGLIPVYAAFNDTSVRNPYGWSWYFGDRNYTAVPWVVQSKASWVGRFGAGLVTMSDGDIIFTSGIGQPNGSTLIGMNDTWKSVDKGVTWEYVNTSNYPSRGTPNVVVLPDDSIVLFGGSNNWSAPLTYYNDTWRSTDKGETWELMNISSGWQPMRAMSSVVLSNGNIVMAGGYDSTNSIMDDVWSSTDKGYTWNRINNSPGWNGRWRFAMVASHDDNIYIMGGATLAASPYNTMNDTWVSTDGGYTWSLRNGSCGWNSRLDPLAAVLPDNSILLFGGYNITTAGLPDVWRSNDGGLKWNLINSTAFSVPKAFWGPAAITTLNDGSVVISGGWNNTGLNDTWRYDPLSSGLQNPNHVYYGYNNFTPYPVVLQAYNDGGWNISTNYIDSRIGAPIASFTQSNSTGIISELVNFTDTSGNFPIVWNWSYNNVTGNNTEIWFSTSQNPNRTFTVGNWSIRLNASSPYGYNISPINTSFVNITLPAPVASFTKNTTSGMNWVLVQFTDTSTNNPTEWNWTVKNVTGNNTEIQISDMQNFNYYLYTGNWSIRLNASSEFGYNKTIDYLHFVNVTSLYATFYANNTEGINEIPVQFIDNSITFGSITSWVWNATDVLGTDIPFVFSYEQHPIYSFRKGNYSIVLRVVDEYGYVGTSQQTTFINVSPYNNASTITYPTIGTPFIVTLFGMRDQSPAINTKVEVMKGDSYEDAESATDVYSTGSTDGNGKYSFMARDNMYYYIKVNNGEYTYMYMGSSAYTTITFNLPSTRLLDRPYRYESTYDDTTNTILTTYNDVDLSDVGITVYDVTFNNEIVRSVNYTSTTYVADSFGVPYSDHEYKVIIDFTRSVSPSHTYSDTKYLNAKTFHSPFTNVSDQWKLFIYGLYAVFMMIVSLAIGYASPKIGSVLLLGLTILGVAMGFLPYSIYTGGVIVCGFIAMLEIMRRREYYNY